MDSISTWGRVGMGMAAIAIILPIFFAGMILVEFTGFVWRRLPRIKREFWIGALSLSLAISTLGFIWVWPASGVNEVQRVMTPAGSRLALSKWRGVSGWLLWRDGHIEAVSLRGIVAQLPVSLIVVCLSLLMHRWGVDRFRLRDPGRCDNCGYDTRTCSDAKCPECGSLITIEPANGGQP